MQRCRVHRFCKDVALGTKAPFSDTPRGKLIAPFKIGFGQ
jgi:hypothetical protein